MASEHYLSCASENQNRCRTCLDIESERVHILEDPLVKLHLKSCLSIIITENDKLSKMICVSCISQLRDFYNFQLNAKCSQDWLESALKIDTKKSGNKIQLQPIPDSEYNSDSLLEFLNNTENIEEYLSNLGKEDVQSIVSMVDKNNEASVDLKNKKSSTSYKNHPDSVVKEMEIDVLDSDLDIVKEMLSKEISDSLKASSKCMQNKVINQYLCFACKSGFVSCQKLILHLNMCEKAMKTCSVCNKVFNSKDSFLLHHVTECTHQQPKTNVIRKQSSIFFRCKKCGAFFNDREQIYCHVKEHLLNVDSVICDVCGHRFTDEVILKTHKNNVHSNNGLMYRCRVCQLTSIDKHKIYMHVQEHSSYLESSKHLCEACEKSFSTRGLLLRHLRAHKTETAIQVPRNGAEWKAIECGFRKSWDFPGCCGAIDGKHVVIKAPFEAGSYFYNNKQQNSIVLMAVVDDDYCFKYIDVRCNGRISDGGVFSNCSLSYALKDGLLPDTYHSGRCCLSFEKIPDETISKKFNTKKKNFFYSHITIRLFRY